MLLTLQLVPAQFWEKLTVTAVKKIVKCKNVVIEINLIWFILLVFLTLTLAIRYASQQNILQFRPLLYWDN